MIIIAVLTALTTCVIMLFAFLVYMKYKKPGNGYKRMSPTSSEILLRQSQRERIQSIFSIHGRPSIQGNGKAPDFDIPLISRKNTSSPKNTCQLHFSLFYNFHLNEITIQVLQAQNLPKLFGLQSGVLVKVMFSIQSNSDAWNTVCLLIMRYRTCFCWFFSYAMQSQQTIKHPSDVDWMWQIRSCASRPYTIFCACSKM